MPFNAAPWGEVDNWFFNLKAVVWQAYGHVSWEHGCQNVCPRNPHDPPTVSHLMLTYFLRGPEEACGHSRATILLCWVIGYATLPTWMARDCPFVWLLASDLPSMTEFARDIKTVENRLRLQMAWMEIEYNLKTWGWSFSSCFRVLSILIGMVWFLSAY